MKAIKKLALSLVLLLSVLGLVMLLFLPSCDEEPDIVDNDDNTDLIIDDKNGKEVTAEFTGKDLNFVFSSGGKFMVKADENSGAENEKIVITLIEDEPYFNTENNVVFDFSKMKREFTINFEYALPKSLVAEDIDLFIYSSGTKAETIDAEIISFNYNAQSGILTAKFKAPSKNPVPGKAVGQTTRASSGNYDRVVLSFTSREELAKNPKESIVKMPFYAQPGATCWAACAAMMGRAYSAVNNSKQEMPIIDYIKYMGHSGLDDGIGLYSFKTYLPGALNVKTGVKFEVSSFLSKSNLLSEIINKLNENKPLILKLNYPGIGGHAILVVGYKIDLVSASKISVKLLYHNPQNVGSETMYKWADFDWLMKDKWMQEAYQILYADIAVPTSRSMYTVGMPLKGQDGQLAFIVPIKRASDGAIVEFPVAMVYNKDAENKYIWEYALGNIKVDVIPDSASCMRFKLPVFNAAQVSKQLSLELRAYDNETGKKLYEKTVLETFQAGENVFKWDIDMNNFLNNVKNTKVRVEVDLREAGTFLDGYTIYFVAPVKQVFDVFFHVSILAKFYRTDNFGGSSDYIEDELIFQVSEITLNGHGNTYTGTDVYISESGLSETRSTLVLELDKATNPTIITKLTFSQTKKFPSYDTYVVRSTGSIELKNIDLKKYFDGVSGYKYGLEVCSFITNATFTQSWETSYGTDFKQLVDYRCTTSSSLHVTIE
jgi:hypothetical protein